MMGMDEVVAKVGNSGSSSYTFTTRLAVNRTYIHTHTFTFTLGTHAKPEQLNLIQLTGLDWYWCATHGWVRTTTTTTITVYEKYDYNYDYTTMIILLSTKKGFFAHP